MYGIYDTTNGKLLSQNQWEKTFTYATARILDNILSTIHEFGADLERYNLRLGAKALKSNLALKCTLFHLK
jgi:hypothetical protein